MGGGAPAPGAPLAPPAYATDCVALQPIAATFEGRRYAFQRFRSAIARAAIAKVRDSEGSNPSPNPTEKQTNEADIFGEADFIALVTHSDTVAYLHQFAVANLRFGGPSLWRAVTNIAVERNKLYKNKRAIYNTTITIMTQN